MNALNPALVHQRAVQRMPRVALWLFCAAYALPGVFGRDPWKNADIMAFGYMMSLVRGDASLFTPAIAGLPTEGGILPHWIGAASIYLLGPWLGAALAARLPFALLLLAAMALVWYATYHLARTEAAQPVAFAFGGEAHPVDYARTIADASVLALIASLGLLQLGHETTPELVQFSAVALYLYALGACPFRVAQARIAVFAALPILAASGGPMAAIMLAAVGALVCFKSSYANARSFGIWVLASGAAAAALATVLSAWVWRLQGPSSARSVVQLLVWFTWPAWPLAGWTLWRWRQHLMHRHIAVPWTAAAAVLLICLAMGGSDRALLLGLPPLAMLAAFALPTLKRSVSAAVDWFSVCFFSIAALAIWIIYVAMQTGIPAKPAANVAKLAPGFTPQFQLWALVCAVLATLAWLGLVRWRAGRHRNPLWKSLVLPAGGVALCWLLLMSLWLPLLDYARSYRPWVQQVAEIIPAGECLQGGALTRSQLAALETAAVWRVLAREESSCNWQLVAAPRSPAPPPDLQGWRAVSRTYRPTDRDESVLVYRRR